MRGLRRAARFARLHPPPLATLAPTRKKNLTKKKSEAENFGENNMKNLKKKIRENFFKIFFFKIFFAKSIFFWLKTLKTILYESSLCMQSFIMVGHKSPEL